MIYTVSVWERPVETGFGSKHSGQFCVGCALTPQDVMNRWTRPFTG